MPWNPQISDNYNIGKVHFIAGMNTVKFQEKKSHSVILRVNFSGVNLIIWSGLKDLKEK